MIPKNISKAASWYESSARDRIDGLLDHGSFREILSPEAGVISPHLALFDLPPAFADGLLIPRGAPPGHPPATPAQEGQFLRGTTAQTMRAIAVALLLAAAHAPRWAPYA